MPRDLLPSAEKGRHRSRLDSAFHWNDNFILSASLRILVAIFTIAENHKIFTCRAKAEATRSHFLRRLEVDFELQHVTFTDRIHFTTIRDSLLLLQLAARCQSTLNFTRFSFTSLSVDEHVSFSSFFGVRLIQPL